MKQELAQAPTGDRKPKIIEAVIIFIVIMIGVLGISFNRGLYADGAFYVLSALSTKTFLMYHDWPRLHTLLIYQLPLVLGINAGIKDVSLLSTLYSIGTIGGTLAIWIFSLWKTRGFPRFWFFLAAFSSVYLVTGFFAVGEYNISFAIVAACASLLSQVRLSKVDGLWLLFFAVLSVRTYESNVLAGVMLATACIARIHSALDGKSSRMLLLISIPLFISSAIVSLFSVLHPRDPQNLSAATSGISNVISPQAGYVMSMLIISFLASLKITNRACKTLLLLSSSLFMVFYISYSWMWINPSFSYSARSLAMFPIFIGLMLVILKCLYPRSTLWKSICSNAYSTTSIFLLFLSLAATNLVDTYGYHLWLKFYATNLSMLSKSTSIEKTRIYQKPSFGRYAWGWTNPTLSYLLGDGKHVIYNENGTAWEPNLVPLVGDGQLDIYRTR